jgi:hypothetical protein
MITIRIFNRAKFIKYVGHETHKYLCKLYSDIKKFKEVA